MRRVPLDYERRRQQIRIDRTRLLVVRGESVDRLGATARMNFLGTSVESRNRHHSGSKPHQITPIMVADRLVTY
jgi:hypothetical protein